MTVWKRYLFEYPDHTQISVPVHRRFNMAWRCVDKAFSFCRYSEYWNLLTLISLSGADFVQSIWRFRLGSEHEECSVFLLFRSFQETQPRLISQTHPVVPAVQTRETFSASALEIDFSLNITTLDFLVDPDALLCSTL